jgi:hypothetical protein
VCIPYNHPNLAGLMYGSNAYMSATKELLTDNFDVNLCKYHRHWNWKVPDNERDIPIDKYYDKKREYIYFYLIECFRFFKHRNENSLMANERILQDAIHREKRLALEINYTKQQILESQQRIERLSKRYKNNDVFDTVSRIDTYHGKKK